jgi:hypothetical protein
VQRGATEGAAEVAEHAQALVQVEARERVRAPCEGEVLSRERFGRGVLTRAAFADQKKEARRYECALRITRWRLCLRGRGTLESAYDLCGFFLPAGEYERSDNGMRVARGEVSLGRVDRCTQHIGVMSAQEEAL